MNRCFNVTMANWLSLLVLSYFLAGKILCEFPCICNFQLQLQVYPDTSHSSPPVGYLYENDCKQDLNLTETDQNWFAVAYKHQTAYVQQGPQVRKQVCPGDPSPDDLVTTLKPATVPMVTATSTAKPTTEAPTTVTQVVTAATTTPTTTSPTPSTPQQTAAASTTAASTAAASTAAASTAAASTAAASTAAASTAAASTAAASTAAASTAAASTAAASTAAASTAAASTAAASTAAASTAAASTAAASTAAASTAAASTAAASTAAASTAAASTAAASTAAASTAAASTAAASTAAASTAAASTAAASTAAASTAAASTAAASTAAASTAAASTAAASTAAASTAAASTAAASTAAASTAAASTAAASTAAASTAAASTAAASTTAASTTAASTTAASTTAASTTAASTTAASTTAASTTAASTTAASTTAASTTVPTTRVTTAATTTPPRTTTETTTMAMITGNTNLCPGIVHQYTLSDNGFLTQYGDKCYELIPHLVSWSHAEYICSHRQGHLVRIPDAAHQTFLHSFIQSHYTHRVWLGLHDREHEEQFQWASGNPISYLNWMPGRKTLGHSTEDCVYMNTDGQWDDVKCGANNAFLEPFQEEHAYMCQYDALTPATSAIAGNTNLCPSNVKSDSVRNDGELGQHNQACYELLTHQKVTWSHAESMCKSRGGHLAYITSADEQAYIQKFMMANSPEHAVWIGLHDTQVENHFQWTSGAPVSYTNWVPGHTSNFQSHPVEDCVAFIPYKNGVWDDIPCGQHNIFFGDGGETHPILCQYRTVSGSGAIG